MRRSRRLTCKKTSYAISGESDNDSDDAEKKSVNVKAFKRQKKFHNENSQQTGRPDAEKNNNKKASSQNEKSKCDDGSSSESDIENYLQPVDQIDFNSDFFQKIDKQTETEKPKSFDAIENSIFAGVNRLSDSESENEYEESEASFSKKNLKTIQSSKGKDVKMTTTRDSFQQLRDYTKKIEETKRIVQRYEAKKKKSPNKQRLSLNKQKKEENLDVSQLLALGETKADSSTDAMKGFESHSESEKEDWEEVEANDAKETNNITTPKDVQVNVELPGVMRRKKGVDLMASIKRRLNRVRKENQILVHKVHLLCWIAHGNLINKILNSKDLLGMALSLLPTELCQPAQTINLNSLGKIVDWYQGTIKNIEKPFPEKISLQQLLKMQINNKRAFNREMLVYIFVCILRALGIECRLVLSFRVAPLRPPANELHSLSTKNKKKKKKTKNKNSSLDSSDEEDIETLLEESKTNEKRINDTKKNNSKKRTSNQDSSEELYEDDAKTVIEISKNDEKQKTKTKLNFNNGNTKRESKQKLKNSKEKANNKSNQDTGRKSDKENKNSKKPKKETQDQITKNNSKVQRKSTRLTSRKIPQLDGVVDSDDESDMEKEDKTVKRHSQRKKPQPTYAESDSADDFVAQKSKNSRKSAAPTKDSGNSKQLKSKPSKAKKAKTNPSNNQNDNDSDYAPELTKNEEQDNSDDEFLVNTEVKVKQKPKPKRQSSGKVTKDKKGIDIWIEVYLEKEQKWISTDIIKGQVNCINELYSRASHPITYIVAWNNNNTIKDVTQRYCHNCNTVTRKLRIDPTWWNETIKPFEDEKTERSKKEDKELIQTQLDKPLPTTISEYKNHPLYALKRHLLKFEALYPPEPAILGFVRKEAVYPRECVYVLHSREYWIKLAKVVKPGEKPYKIVTRPVWDKINKCVLKDQPLDIFGEWQVQDYEPPTAENGIVPRNEYGNVELFKSCMLPKGCVHLRLEALTKLARKMGIDCASAIVGFDVSHGFIHPVYDGFVVCEEFEEVLVAAWHMEQEELERKGREKLEKRVYGNWKKLIKGLLIRERLNAKYNFAEPMQTDETTKTKKRKLTQSKIPAKKRVGNKNESNSDSDE